LKEDTITATKVTNSGQKRRTSSPDRDGETREACRLRKQATCAAARRSKQTDSQVKLDWQKDNEAHKTADLIKREESKAQAKVAINSQRYIYSSYDYSKLYKGYANWATNGQLIIAKSITNKASKHFVVMNMMSMGLLLGPL